MTNEENCQIFSVFRPKSGTPLDYYIAKFDANSSVDFKNCTSRMERENNFKELKSMYGTGTDMPTSGAGSEYGKVKREEARRKKFGFKARQYDPKSQPFILKMGAGKDLKKMKGTKNGGVTKNAGYVAFVLTSQKNFISLPVSDWYNFAPVSKRKILSIEEVEEQFTKRDKIYNYFAIMSDKKNGKRKDGNEDFDGKPAKRRKRNRFDDDIETLSDSEKEEGFNSDDDDVDDRKNKERNDRNEQSEDEETVAENNEDEGGDEGQEFDYPYDPYFDEPHANVDDEGELIRDVDEEDLEEMVEFGLDDDDEEEEQLDNSDDEEDSDKEGEEKFYVDSDSDEEDSSIEPPVVKENTVVDKSPVSGKRKSDGPESASKKPKLEAPHVSSVIENMEYFVRDCLKEPTSTSELMTKVSSQFSKSLTKKELQQNLILIMKKLNPKSRNIEGAKHFFL